MKKYKLYSALHRCQPCRVLIDNLNYEFPEWKDHIEYVNADEMTPEQREFAQEVSIMSLPCFTDSEKIISVGFSPAKLKKIIEHVRQGDTEQSGDL